MISDFICITELSKTQYSLKCLCSLPDPDLESNDDMIGCGTILLEENAEKGLTELSVHLDENFVNLCIGETYSRKHFISTLISIFQINYDYDLSNVSIVLHDCFGDYVGRYENMEDIIYQEK